MQETMEYINKRFSREEILKLHPDPETAMGVAVDILLGAYVETRTALLRALDYQAITPNGLSIKNTVRATLDRTSVDNLLAEHANVG